MEQLSLMLGVIMMLVAAVGIVLYVALVIAIPVCRAIDWLAGSEDDERATRPARARTTVLARAAKLARQFAAPRRPNGDV